MEIKEITELILQQTWHWNFVDPRCYIWDLYCTCTVAQLRQDYEFMSPSPPFSSLCIGRTENVRWLAGGSLARTTQGYSSWPSHNWRKYADLWDLCWHFGPVSPGVCWEEEEEEEELREVWLEVDGNDDDDPCDVCDVGQTSPLPPYTVHTSPLVTNRRKREQEYHNYTPGSLWFPRHPVAREIKHLAGEQQASWRPDQLESIPLRGLS